MKFALLLALVTVPVRAVRQHSAVSVRQQKSAYGPKWVSLRAEAEADVVSHSSTDTASTALVPAWQVGLFTGLALIVGMAVGGAICYFVATRKKKAETATTEADADPAPEAVAEDPAVASDGKEPVAQETEGVDYEHLIKVVCQRVAQTVGPKLAKGQAVRSIIEKSVTDFRAKAKTFFLNEVNTTAGDLLRAVEAEEAMLLLDWNAALAANFPPLSVLLAGLLSPALLSLRQVAHLMQLVLGILPILVLCTWAVIRDWNTICVIPTIYVWLYVQGGLAVLLVAVHLMIYLRIASGKASLAEKAQSMTARLQASRKSNPKEEGEGMGLSEMRELFICSSVLLQKALLVEDSVRNSIWHTLSGVLSVAWMITALWNLVIVLGWTFMPGMIAFHPRAYAVAPDEFCGALVTVLVARLICVWHLMFFFVNVITMMGWVSDVMTSCSGFGNSILKQAAKCDEGMLGIPVVQLLVKAFVLHGNLDRPAAQLAVTVHEKYELEKQRAEAQQRVDYLDVQLRAHEAEEQSLKEKVKGEDDDLEASINQLESLVDADAGAWKEKGSAAITEMQKRAANLEAATTRDLEVMMQKLMDAAEAIRGSEAYASTMSKAQEAAAAASKRASEVSEQLSEQLTPENLQKALEQAQDLTRVGVSQAREAAERLSESEGFQQARDAAEKLKDSEAFKQAQTSLQHAASSAAGVASEAHESLQRAASSAAGVASEEAAADAKP